MRNCVTRSTGMNKHRKKILCINCRGILIHFFSYGLKIFYPICCSRKRSADAFTLYIKFVCVIGKLRSSKLSLWARYPLTNINYIDIFSRYGNKTKRGVYFRHLTVFWKSGGIWRTMFALSTFPQDAAWSAKTRYKVRIRCWYSSYQFLFICYLLPIFAQKTLLLLKFYFILQFSRSELNATLHIDHWFSTSGLRTISCPQKPKCGPRTILILWLGMVRRSFYLIIIINFYYTYMHSSPCYQDWYKSGPWSRKRWEPLIQKKETVKIWNPQLFHPPTLQHLLINI